VTWGQLETLRAELGAVGYDLQGNMSILGIPVQLTPPGSGLWVSCISNNEVKK
jgi:hypothetical protein